MKSPLALRALAEELTALTEVHRNLGPVPLDAYFAEAATLVQTVKVTEIRARLVAVGLEAEKLDKLPTVLVVAEEAQEEWLRAKERSYSAHVIELIERAHKARRELLAAARFHLGGEPAAEVLGSLAESEGLEDLVADLLSLSLLVEDNARAFRRDRTFDAFVHAVSARQLAHELQEAEEEERFDAMQRQVREKRDRAFTLLASLVDEARRTGRYAFRNDPALLQRFRSDVEYSRQVRKRRSSMHTRDEEGEATLVPPAP